MADDPALPDVNDFLFGDGLTVSDYALSDGVISFRARNGRHYDLIIDHPELWAAAKARLRELNVSANLDPP